MNYAKINFVKKHAEKPPLLLVLLYRLFQLVVVGAAESGHDVLVFDEHERRHGHDVVLHGDILALVHVHLENRFNLLSIVNNRLFRKSLFYSLYVFAKIKRFSLSTLEKNFFFHAI